MMPALDLKDMRKPRSLFDTLIRRDDLTMMPLLGIHRRVDIEELDQAVKCLLGELLALLIQAFLILPDREADYGILAHEEVFTVRAGDEAVLKAVEF